MVLIYTLRMNAVNIKTIIRCNQVHSDSCFSFPLFQMVVLMDPMEDPDDILRAHRSREKTYMFDVIFDYSATQASSFCVCACEAHVQKLTCFSKRSHLCNYLFSCKCICVYYVVERKMKIQRLQLNVFVCPFLRTRCTDPRRKA